MKRLEQSLNKPSVVLVVGVIAVALNVLLYFGYFLPRTTPLVEQIYSIGTSLPEAISGSDSETGNKSDPEAGSKSDPKAGGISDSETGSNSDPEASGTPDSETGSKSDPTHLPLQLKTHLPAHLMGPRSLSSSRLGRLSRLTTRPLLSFRLYLRLPKSSINNPR